MTKLIDALGTKYVYKAFETEVIQLLNSEDEIDTAGARITFDVMRRISDACWSGTAHVIDSSNPNLNAFYEEQRKRGELCRQCTEEQEKLYRPAEVERLVPSIKALEPETIYYAEDISSSLWYSYVFLVQAFRPDVIVQIGAGLAELFTAIYSSLFPNKYRWDEFYVLTGTTYTIHRPDPADYEAFIRNNVVVPTAFGRDELMLLDEWRACCSKMANTFKRECQPRYHKISDYLDI